MKYTFTNGTTQQQSLWRSAFDHLLHIPSSALPLQITVSFVSPGSLSKDHTTLADTFWTYGSIDSEQKVRSDAPGFGDAEPAMIAEAAAFGVKFNITRFYQETAIHELGHAVFAALPEATRIAIAKMFGAKGDEISELQPEGVEWKNRIMEGIAETFKEAFLPSSHRVFPNRTNRRISYAQFATFRRLVREGIAEMESEGEPIGPGETEVPKYNVDIFAEGQPVFEESYANPTLGKEGKKGLWQSSYVDLESGPGLHNSQLNHASKWEGWVLDGTVLSYFVHMPVEVFDPSVIGAPYIEPKAILQSVNDCAILWNLFIKKKLSAEETYFDRAYWSLTAITKKQFEENASTIAEWVEPNWIIYYEARGLGAPPVTFSSSVPVNSTNFTETRKCHGAIYRRVWIYGQISNQMTLQYPETTAEQERLREALTYKFIPSLEFKQPGCSAGSGEKGEPIVIPIAQLEPQGATSTAKPHGRPVSSGTA